MAGKFLMVNDQSGEEKEASLDNELEMRQRGFRVKDVATYNSLVTEADAERKAKIAELMADDPAAKRQQANDERNYQDAVLTAQRTYPNAKGEARVNEDKVATDQPQDTPAPAPGSVRARTEGEAANPLKPVAR